MKRTAGGVVTATFFERYATVNDLDNIDAIEHIVDKLLRNKSGHKLL